MTECVNDYDAKDAYEEAQELFFHSQQEAGHRRPAPLTPTLLAALGECEQRYYLLRTYKPGAYKKCVLPGTNRGIAVHAKRERFLKKQQRLPENNR